MFVKETPEDDHPKNDQHSPDPRGPMNSVSWYDAAAYCNWLSRKENLPECYEPNERGKYAAGMRIKTDALKLPGYRLPTEAEWEYACRSGAVTSRYYGSSDELLEQYAQYYKAPDVRALPCGSLLPNDLGLSDMLGNVWEWCQDEYLMSGTGRNSHVARQTNIITVVNEQSPRLLRGGSFDYRAALVRSANRVGYSPAYRFTDHGFRPARTHPDPLRSVGFRTLAFVGSMTTNTRIDLKVPYIEKDQAKIHGAQWDTENRTWYAPAGETTDQSTAPKKAEEGVALSELLDRVKGVINEAFPTAVWVRAKVSELRGKNGHLYLTLTDAMSPVTFSLPSPPRTAIGSCKTTLGDWDVRLLQEASSAAAPHSAVPICLALHHREELSDLRSVAPS